MWERTWTFPSLFSLSADYLGSYFTYNEDWQTPPITHKSSSQVVSDLFWNVNGVLESQDIWGKPQLRKTASKQTESIKKNKTKKEPGREIMQGTRENEIKAPKPVFNILRNTWENITFLKRSGEFLKMAKE